MKKKVDHGHGKYITTQEFNKLMADNSPARLAQTKLATKTDMDDFVKETDSDNKLKNINKKVTSNKTRHVEVKTKLDNLAKKVIIMSTNGLTVDMINKYSTLNEEKKFFFRGTTKLFSIYINWTYLLD